MCNQITQIEPKSLVRIKFTSLTFSLFAAIFSLVGHFKVVDAEPGAVVLVEAGVAGLPPQAARFASVVVQRPLGSTLSLSPLQTTLLMPLLKEVCYLLQLLLLPGLLPPPPLLGPLPPEAGRDPRLRSLHCPFQVLLLHSECLSHILTPQTVTSFLAVLPPHPQPFQGIVFSPRLYQGVPTSYVKASRRRRITFLDLRTGV